ncbi:MAG: TIGR02444 family protein [Pseudomonadota bacterium]
MSEDHFKGLWECALAAYASPGVASLCLAAQDDFGFDVNMILFAAWCAREGRVVSRENWILMNERLTPWRDGVVAPLREQRRRWVALDSPGSSSSLSSSPGPCSSDGLYPAIKAVELEAERQQLQMMADAVELFSIGVPTASVDLRLKNSFEALCSAQGQPSNRLDTLHAALSKTE